MKVTMRDEIQTQIAKVHQARQDQYAARMLLETVRDHGGLEGDPADALDSALAAINQQAQSLNDDLERHLSAMLVGLLELADEDAADGLAAAPQKAKGAV